MTFKKCQCGIPFLCYYEYDPIVLKLKRCAVDSNVWIVSEMNDKGTRHSPINHEYASNTSRMLVSTYEQSTVNISTAASHAKD